MPAEMFLKHENYQGKGADDKKDFIGSGEGKYILHNRSDLRPC